MGEKRIGLIDGGWFDLTHATILWAAAGLVWRVKPTGLLKGGERYTRVLFRTPNGNYVVKDYSGGLANPTQYYEQVSKSQAYSWLLKYAPRKAKRLFPDDHKQRLGER
jgi:hypothetical protein